VPRLQADRYPEVSIDEALMRGSYFWPPSCRRLAHGSLLAREQAAVFSRSGQAIPSRADQWRADPRNL